jgi:hypothetical protein
LFGAKMSEAKVEYLGPPGIPRKKYDQYIKSPEWAERRKAILARDNFECRTCPNSENLQVHHRRYDHFGNEPMEDLVTLCIECHDAITNVLRSRRHTNRLVKPRTIDPVSIDDTLRNSNVSHKNVQDTRSNPVAPPQWVFSGPVESDLLGAEESFGEESED